MQSFRNASKQVLDAGAVLTARLVNLCIYFLGVLSGRLNANLLSLGIVHLTSDTAQHELACIRLLLKLVNPILQTFKRLTRCAIVN